MHPKAVDEIIHVCRQWEAGRNPIFADGVLIDAILELARQRDHLRARLWDLMPGERCEAGVLHWEAPSQESK